MARDIVPIAQMNARMPEAGRIRIGQKGAKGEPQKLKHFRMTSHDESAIREIATLYGGTVRQWAGAPTDGQWEVYTNVAELPIVLPPDPLGGTPVYEAWTAGGIQRRCDGVTMQVPRATPDGAEMVDEPCQCAKNQRLACKVTTRLNVVLRDVRFGGSWRLESHGFYAAHELPGMVKMIETLQGAGIVSGLLLLKEHSRVVQTQRGPMTRKFMVPALAVAHSVAALASGDARLGALAPAPAQAITAGPDGREASGPAVEIPDWIGDDDIADAELVVDEAEVAPDSGPGERAGTTAADGTEDGAGGDTAPPAPLGDDDWRARTTRRMHALVRDVREACEPGADADSWRHGIVATATKGTKTSSADLTDDELRAVVALLEDVKEGRRRYLGFSMGKVRLSAKAAT